ncbi:hypothetical protein F5Y11DRAFT_170767 [Daldinia sp. FL1419]|nr:hypothetical protein F5Y11DRAFT_170767 [Daldinia sp. FL1419]
MKDLITAPWELDPEGDVLLTLHNPKAPFAVWDDKWYEKTASSRTEQPISRHQDSNIHEADPQTQTIEPVKIEPELSTLDQPISPSPTVQFILSSKHLILASEYFKNSLRGPWKEATSASSDGRRHVDAYDWDDDAMLLLMRIIHGHNYKVPYTITLETLARLAVLVDYYQCNEVVTVWLSIWLSRMTQPEHNSFGRDHILWILVSWVFEKGPKFVNATRLAMEECPGELPTLGLPITNVAG